MSPRTEKQYEEIRERSRSRIMQAALELFAAKGFNSTTVEMIASRSEVSKGLLYNYFRNKEDLLNAIVDEGVILFERMEELCAGPLPPEEKLKEILEISLSPELLNESFWRLYFSMLSNPETLPQVSDKMFQMSRRSFELVAELMRQTGRENPREEAFIFNVTIDGAAMNYWFDPENFPLEGVRKLLIEKYSRKKQEDES